MIVVTVVAVLICLLQNLGIVGAMAALGMAIAFSVFAACRRGSAEVEMGFDLIWGIVLPVLCLSFDPVLFQPDPGVAMTKSMPTAGNFQWTAFAVLSYLTLGLQMIALLIWIGAGHRFRRLSGLMAGVLWAGFALALTIALAFPIGGVITLVYMFDAWNELVSRLEFMGAKSTIAILAVTPLFTARTFWRRARQATEAARSYFDPQAMKRRVAAGMLGALVVPLLVLLAIQGPAALVELMPYLFGK